MIHSILDEYNFKTGDIIFIDSVLKLIIETVEDEQGVRNLRRGLVDIISNINLGRMLELDVVSFPYTVTENDVKKYIHVNNANEKKVPHLMYI
jgi:ATP-dependent Lon protease